MNEGDDIRKIGLMIADKQDIFLGRLLKFSVPLIFILFTMAKPGKVHTPTTA